MHLSKKKELLQKRIWRVRRKVVGTAERPRLCVSFTNKHTYAQIIDDEAGKTLFSASSLGKDVRGENLSANSGSATRLGKLIAERALAAGVGAVVFDRHGRQYHGAVKAFADAAREAGLKF